MRLLPYALCLGALLACAPRIDPVRVAVTRSEAQLARGEYLARAVMACGACHSERDWTKVNGPVKDGAEFAGSGDLAREERYSEKFSFAAPNLTPHHLGNWTDGEVARAIVFGQRPDRRGLFPYMPYFEYREALARDDLSAVVAFLRTLPPQPGPPTVEARFPMPGFVLNRFPEERPLREKAPAPGETDYGKYLTEIAGCLACHTEADKRGAFTGPRYGGGREFKVPAPGAGVVRSANLTPDPETGLGAWTREQFIARFKSASLDAVRGQDVPPGGFNSVMPYWAWARMREEDLGAIFDFLRSLPPEKRRFAKHSSDPPR
ncbi:MAG: cytochrome C [Myxococcota bacterium]